MDDFTPAVLTTDAAAANLRAKLESLENERLQFGAELDALDAMADSDAKIAGDPGFAQEREQARRNVIRADARIASHTHHLERIAD